MRDVTDDLRTALGQWVEQASTDPGPHAEAGELAALHSGKLAAALEERLRRHLLVCDECRELLLEVESFQPAAADAGAEAAWKALAPRLAAEPPAGPAPAEPRQDEDGRVIAFAHPAPRTAAPRWPLALAASFLVAALGLGGWALSLRRQVSELSALNSPELNTPIVDLYPESARRSEPEGKGPVELAPETRLVTLVLNLPGRAEHRSYRVEISAAVDGRTLWRGDGFVPNAYGSLTLTLPWRLLGPGQYRVRLFGSGESQPVDAYELVIHGG